MIVKIRLSDVVSAGFRMAEIESQDGKLKFLLPMNSPLQARMNGRDKMYFQVEIGPDRIEIGDEISGQEW